MKPMESKKLQLVARPSSTSQDLASSPTLTSRSGESSRLTPGRPRSSRREYLPPRVVRRGGASPDPSAPDDAGGPGT